MVKKKQRQTEKKSNLKGIYIILALLIILAAGVYFLAAGNKQQGELPADDYNKLNTTYEPGKVKITEFMKFDCVHCYDLHKDLPQLLQKYGDKVEITYIPIVFPRQSTKSIEAYLIAEQMGKGEEMRDALFEAKFEKGMDIMESTIALETVAASIGLGADFNQKLESNTMKDAAQYNLKLANDYNVEGTPSVFINGKFQKDYSAKNLDTVIGSTLEQGK